MIILVAGALGYARVRLSTRGVRQEPINADDSPDQARPKRRHALRTTSIWGLLWMAPIVLVASLGGWESVFTRIALFFSWLAVVTFGGAYAVLAYVAEAAVTGFAWLTPGEMLDGLALAETTPGPLILMLSYVGYLAAFGAPTGLPPVLAGLAGGLLTAWVTFVPCFLWIFLGAPYVERLRGRGDLAGALSAVTAAVVGVILNLAVWLGLHVLFSDVGTLTVGFANPAWPVWVTLDLWAAALLAIAAVALTVFRLGIPTVLATCGVLGALIHFA